MDTLHVLSGRGNPDGMHWGWSAHDVGMASAALLRRPLACWIG